MTETDDMTPATSEESIVVPEPSGRRRTGRHAAYNILVKRAVMALKAKSGSSRKAVIKYICAHETVKKSHCTKAVGRALRRMVASGHLYKNKTGRYKLTAKGRGLSSKRGRKGRKGRKGRRTRRRKGKKGKKGKKAKKGKKSKKGKKKRKARKGRKSRKSRRSRRRKAPKRANRRRKASKRKGTKGKKRSVKRRRR